MNYLAVLNGIIAFVGICLIFSGLQMKKTGEISTLLVNQEEIKKCRNKEKFILAVYKKMLVFGLILLLFGLFSFANDIWFRIGQVYNVVRLAFLAVCYLALSRIRAEKDKFF